MYKRVLLKLSGEQLQGSQGHSFDVQRAQWIVSEIKKIENTQIVIMVGGGNYVRGAQFTGGGVNRVTADNIGMLATLMNGLALADIFNSKGLDTRVLSNIKADQVVDQFTHRRALHHLAKKRIVIIAGGIGRPYLTTDTAAVSLALELDCDVILKATKVDGVYEADPVTHPMANKLKQLTLQQAVAQADIRIMDKAAIALACEHDQPVIVFELLKPDNIQRAVAGKSVGTLITK